MQVKSFPGIDAQNWQDSGLWFIAKMCFGVILNCFMLYQFYKIRSENTSPQ